MKQFKKLIPAFWNHQDVSGSHVTSFNFRKKWKLLVFFTSFMALSPLIVMTFVEFSLTQQIIENEVKLSMSQILNAAATSVAISTKNETDINNDKLDSIISQLGSGKDNDIFIVNKNGTLLTDSYYYGNQSSQNILNSINLNNSSNIESSFLPNGEAAVIGHLNIQNTALIVVFVKSKKWMSDLWLEPRIKLVGYLAISIILILLSIMGTATYLVRRIHSSDQKRVEALHHAEYTNKLASIGRLASGVAHEINNPLAIINQKTGLILDLLSLNEKEDLDPRLIPLSNDVLDTVIRCGSITKRLLDFARHMEPSIELVNLEEVINQIIAFLKKEAERKHIKININIKKSVPDFESDKGSLQQICLNLFDNAITAMSEGGLLTISVKYTRKKQVILIVSDTGKGICGEDIPKIFEPFYSSKSGHWGSGLGLSITYGLVKEIGGDILVKSSLGKGTEFTLMLPIKTTKINS